MSQLQTVLSNAHVVLKGIPALLAAWHAEQQAQLESGTVFDTPVELILVLTAIALLLIVAELVDSKTCCIACRVLDRPFR